MPHVGSAVLNFRRLCSFDFRLSGNIYTAVYLKKARSHHPQNGAISRRLRAW